MTTCEILVTFCRALFRGGRLSKSNQITFICFSS